MTEFEKQLLGVLGAMNIGLGAIVGALLVIALCMVVSCHAGP